MSANIQPSPSARLVAPVVSKKSPFPEGWDSAQAIQLGGEGVPEAPVKPDLYGRWVRMSNFSTFVHHGFAKAEKTHMTKTFAYWDDKDQAFRWHEHILMVCPMKKALQWKKGNYVAANARLSNRFANFQQQKKTTAAGADVYQNYIPEVKWDGPKAHFPEDEAKE